ncbi:tRNA (adenosine(37)-N6)-threonylcarbamoyltransferase complex transferase subunit TsaD [Candidatus Tremblaya phenacola]|uniref:N(6)-L-threonylcarbamoyladenine synthase n=1 Tax=Candidatus Tremblayella phenacoccinincola TaxID=1010676 RepID=A0A2G0V728_9PROT|nr:tRNA (adenosine(37)-N6)-threonylcarbamoyltransferase complex transferase subunit TsaD [Candidatus Tremblaya phenacola]PHN16263.1 tRNA N6-adenosine threonylcarbamoyltransferase [Candidatus Tremblaya phenacola]
MRFLGIETSCDDTGISIVEQNKDLIISYIYNQLKDHISYGGVVPELASKKHLEVIIKLIKKTILKPKLTIKSLTVLAYTAGSGMFGSLLIGTTIGCALAYSLNISSLAINHLEGHILTPMLNNKVCFPYIVAIVSGGHSEMLLVYKLGVYIRIGKTIDDSVGEVFDKAAKLLELSYPSGISLSNIASAGIPNNYRLPYPMQTKPTINISLSGLKTLVTTLLKKKLKTTQTKADIAKALEDTIITVLLNICNKALASNNVNRLAIVGGVSANGSLRNYMKVLMKPIKGAVYSSDIKLCSDNGAMIAFSGLTKNIPIKTIINKSLSVLIKPTWNLAYNIM